MAATAEPIATTVSPEQRKALDAQCGEPIYVVDPERNETFVLVSLGEMTAPDQSDEWNDERAKRRSALIRRQAADQITDRERAELAVLDHQANRYFNRIAPRPIDGARRLLEKLKEASDQPET